MALFIIFFMWAQSNKIKVVTAVRIFLHFFFFFFLL
jgi:hypothetical protein